MQIRIAPTAMAKAERVQGMAAGQFEERKEQPRSVKREDGAQAEPGLRSPARSSRGQESSYEYSSEYYDEEEEEEGQVESENKAASGSGASSSPPSHS